MHVCVYIYVSRLFSCVCVCASSRARACVCIFVIAYVHARECVFTFQRKRIRSREYSIPKGLINFSVHADLDIDLDNEEMELPGCRRTDCELLN